MESWRGVEILCGGGVCCWGGSTRAPSSASSAVRVVRERAAADSLVVANNGRVFPGEDNEGSNYKCLVQRLI